MDEDKKFIVRSTKISPESAMLLDRLAKKKGLTVYELLQMVVDTFCRYMSDKYNLTPEMQQIMEVFEHAIGWENALNLADPTVVKNVAEATYYLSGEGKQGVRAVHVTRPYFGDWQQTVNIQEILEKTLNYLFPERYKKLRHLVTEMECGSILELLDLMIDAQTIRMLDAEYRQDFEDCARSDYGRKPWETPFVRKHHRTPDSIQKPEPIKFGDADQAEDTADY